MTLSEVLPSVEQLSVGEKLALIEAAIRMVRQSVEVGGGNGSSSIKEQELAINAFSIGFPAESVAEAILELMNRPDPEPSQIIQPGVFKGRIPCDDQFFHIAEWHPAEGELRGE